MAPSQASPPRSKPPSRPSPRYGPRRLGRSSPLSLGLPVRHSGDPIWVRLPGFGKDDDWSEEEEERTQRLRAELNPETTKATPARWPRRCAAAARTAEGASPGGQPADRREFAGTGGRAHRGADGGVAGPGLGRHHCRVCPLGLHVRPSRGQADARDRAPTLLALADPAYPKTKKDTPAPTPPDAGLAIARVVPNGNADLNGIQAGDVLLTYAGTTLKEHADLKDVAPGAGPKKVPVRYWREGITREVAVAAGPLGVTIANRPAKAAVLARQAAERVLLGMGGGSHQRLPGTRREVEAVARLFPAGMVTTVMGEQACESTVQDLARSGRLKASATCTSPPTASRTRGARIARR